MDINYILGREQTSLHNARTAASACARAVHRGLAARYGLLLADSTFPHRQPIQLRLRADVANGEERWNDDGGTARDDEGSALRGHIVQTPHAPQPYKTVLENDRGPGTERSARSVREGEAYIRRHTRPANAGHVARSDPPGSG